MNTDSASSTAKMHSARTIDIDALAHLPGTIILPPVGSEAAVSQRHEVNPALALNALGDIQALVVLWRDQLREVVRSLHAIHAQGPMVDGWLESSAQASHGNAQSTAAEATLLRHGDAEALMKYVESLDVQPLSAGNSGLDAQATQYRLCSLDQNGQVRSQPCPPEQMGTVSIAIARYQKFKQLMGQKQALEAKLQTSVDQLNAVRSSLQQENLL